MHGTPIVVRAFDPEYPTGRIPLRAAGIVVALGSYTENRAKYRDRDGCPDPAIFYWNAIGAWSPKIGDLVGF